MFVLPKINPSFETKELKVSEAEYHAIRDAVHYSDLKHMIKSPHAFYRNLKFRKEPTPTMRLGTLAHKAILEGRDFLQDYVVEPIFKGLTKEGKETTSANATAVKEAKAEWYAQIGDKKVITQEEYDRLGFMMESILAHRFVNEVFKDGITEVRGQWLDETGIGCTYGIDFLTNDMSLQLDLKTTRDSSHHAFSKLVERQFYYLQDSMYATGLEKVYGKKPKTRLWIACENVEPYECRVHYIDELYQEAGDFEFRLQMNNLKSCLQLDSWPQGQNLIESLEPSFYFKSFYEPRLNS